MALIKISQLPPGDSDLSPNDVVPFVDAETQTTKKVSIQGLSDYFNVQGIVDSAIAGSHDSALIQGQIDSSLADYAFAYWDSAQDLSMLTSTVDSAYVQARQSVSGFDSGEVQGMIDSSFANYQFDYFQYDSAVVQGQIDSSLGVYNFFDSAQMQAMIDSSMDSALSDLGMDASPTNGATNDF